MAEKTIFSNPHRRVFLVMGETNDWYIGQNLVMVNFETFLSHYLQEIGYEHVMFYGGNTFRGKYVLDERSSRYIFQKENEKKMKELPPSSEEEKKSTKESEQAPKEAEKPRRRRPGEGRRPQKEQQSEVMEQKTELEAWETLTYGKEHISQAVFCGQFKEFMSDTKHNHAMVFSDLDAFLNTEYYTNYMEMLSGWIEQPSRSKNIVIFIASGYSIRQLETIFRSRPNFARMFADIGSGAGEGESGGMHFDSSRVLSLYLPGEDECIRLLEHLRVVGIRDKAEINIHDIKESLEAIQERYLRLEFDVREEKEIARVLRFHCYETATKEKRLYSPLVEMEHRISHYMKENAKQGNGKVWFDASAASQIYGHAYKKQVSALEELNRPGWESVYQVLCDVIADNERQKEWENKTGVLPNVQKTGIWSCQRILTSVSSESMISIPHFLLMGPPGTGKTTIAGKIGQILNEAGILTAGHMVRVRGAELISGHVGGTAHLVADAVERAKNGVLFLDEAYGLVDQTGNHGRDFAQAAIDTLVAYCGEEQQDEFPFCLVLAGYPDELEPIFQMNPGLRRRLTYTLELKPYSAEHLASIYLNFIESKGYTIEPELREGMTGFFERLRTSVPSREFGNAGTAVQEIGEELTIRNCNVRDMRNKKKEKGYQERRIQKEDFGSYTKYFSFKNQDSTDAIEDMRRRVYHILDSRVGNQALKEKILDMLDQVEYNLRYPEAREQVEPGYYFFVGPAGTGKSTAADTLALCLKEMDIITEETVISCSAKDLISNIVGDTRGKTDALLIRSYKRVLLIDEAYALRASGGQHDYQSEAMTQIVAFLDKEENRKNCCIIFAGYQDEMRELTEGQTGNSGLLSRIGENVIKFVPYTGKECANILRVMAHNDSALSYEVSDDVMNYYVKQFEMLRKHPRFANGRTVREVFKLMKKRIKKRAVKQKYAPNDMRNLQFSMQDVLSEEELWNLLSQIDR